MPPHVILGDTSNVLFQTLRNQSKNSRKVINYKVHDFRPINTLGRGNMGTVLLVALRNSDVPFAMKIMKKDAAKQNRSKRTSMEREILSILDHPFLPTLHSHFESEKHSSLVIDFCSGGDLNVLRQKQPEKRFSEAAAQFYAAEVLVALEYLHKLGIVYRDLKPENILIQESGHIMLTDFDLSLKLEGEDWTPRTSQEPVQQLKKSAASKQCLFTFRCMRPCFRVARPKDNNASSSQRKPGVITPVESKIAEARRTGETFCFVGTEEYVAPEILWGTGHGFPVDWWTFGVFLYELIYGTTPFKGRSRKETFYKILQRDPEFPGSWSPLKDLIQKLLVKEPEQRLGFGRGADEIKAHKFFEGLRWDSLEYVYRTPFIPPPFSLSEFEKKMENERLLSKGANAGCERDSGSSHCSGGSSDNIGEIGSATLEEMFISRDQQVLHRETITDSQGLKLTTQCTATEMQEAEYDNVL